MPYLQRRSIAFGSYIGPRHAPHRRRAVQFAGHYGMQWIGLGSLGDADWSGFISTLQNAILPAPPFLPIGRLVLQRILGTTSPSPSQINPSVANQLILALGTFQLSGAAGAYRDALWQQLVRYVANPPQLPAPAPAPTPAPAAPTAVAPAPIITPASPVTTAAGAPVVTSSGATPSWASAVAGTPVPLGYPITQIFVEPNGNQWMFDQASGTWKNATQAAKSAAITSEQQQAAQIAAATATSPGGPESPTLVTSPTVSPYLPQQPSLSPVNVSVSSPISSGYSDILNWLTQSTLISPLPNWILLAGAGFVAIKLGGKGHLL
jgi:hypothetical protein